MANHVCPFWVGYLLACPLRKLIQNPREMLGPYVQPGMTALDIGCAMGFFSVPLAELVGPEGRVVCVDLQEKMLRSLESRAAKSGVLDRIDSRVCEGESLALGDLDGQVDFALAFAVVHEVPDPPGLFDEIHACLKPEGLLYMAEPKGHTLPIGFDGTVALAEEHGFQAVDRPRVRGANAAVLRKK